MRLTSEWFHKSIGEHVSCGDMRDFESTVLDTFTHEMELGPNVTTLAMETGFSHDGDGGSIVREEFSGGEFSALAYADVMCHVV